MLFLSLFACGALGNQAGQGAQNRSPALTADEIAKGAACRGDDPNRLCLALKYVAYVDANGAPVVNAEQAQENLVKINEVWKQCDIGFEIEQYQAVSPGDYGLPYSIANYPDLTAIREVFGDDQRLLLVTTGTWNRSGTLGKTGANAWTSMPGGAPYGAIFEKPVGTYPNILAHELGHYLNLEHVGDAQDIMNAIIYTTSLKLFESQCATARSTALSYWPRMAR